MLDIHFAATNQNRYCIEPNSGPRHLLGFTPLGHQPSHPANFFLGYGFKGMPKTLPVASLHLYKNYSAPIIRD
jgi:hypothetical protein